MDQVIVSLLFTNYRCQAFSIYQSIKFWNALPLELKTQLKSIHAGGLLKSSYYVNTYENIMQLYRFYSFVLHY